MNRDDIRARLLARHLKSQDFNDSLPDLPELDGQLSLIELTAAATSRVDKLATGQDGSKDEGLQMGGMVAQSLVTRDTKERVFADTDIEAVAAMGLSVLTPISVAIASLSGISQDALSNALKNLPATPANASSTSSPASSAEVLPAAS